VRLLLRSECFERALPAYLLGPVREERERYLQPGQVSCNALSTYVERLTALDADAFNPKSGVSVGSLRILK